MNNKIMGTVLWIFALPVLLLGFCATPTLAEGLQETELSADSSEIDSSDSDYIVDWTECDTCVWSIDSEGALVVKPANGNETGSLPSIPWSDYKSKVRSVKFLDKVKASRLWGAFRDMPKLEQVDLNGLDSSNVTDMSCMFCNCSSLISINLSDLDTRSVNKMPYMFSGCSRLISLDVSGLDTSSVTDMRGMFSGCSSLSSLNLADWDVSCVASMPYMFSGCSRLISLDVSGLDTSSVTDMSGMFSGCSSLSSLNLADWDVSCVTSMSGMFSRCTSLTSLQLFGLETLNVSDMSRMFYCCSSLVSLDLSNMDTLTISKMGSMFNGCSSLVTLILPSTDAPYLVDMSDMFYGCSSLSSLISTGFNASNVVEMHSMFVGCSSLGSLDLSSIGTSSVSDMSYMFLGCSALASLDLSNFDTTGASKMSGMFSGCAALKQIRLGANFSFNGKDKSRQVSLPGNWWRSSVDGLAYAPEDVPNNVAATYTRAEDLSLAKIAIDNQTYTGLELEPKPKVTLNGIVLISDVDYDVLYSKNINAGDATVSIMGKGSYVGTASASFSIAAMDASDALITIDEQATYSGFTLEPKVTVLLGGKTLSVGTDYTLSFLNNINVGTATVKATFKGNYKGTVTSCFDIAPLSISTASVLADSQIFTGSVLMPSVTLILDGREINYGGNYVISYSNNVNVGIATITISCFGNCEGTATGFFTIAPADISGVQVGVDSEQTYTGAAITPVPTVTLNGKTLQQGSDYDVSYSNNVNVGTATVAVIGKGNYTGTATTTFEIIAPPTPTPEPTPTPSITFLDVNSSTPHNEDISWLASAGVSTGWDVTGGKEFRPYANVARCDMAAFLYRLAGSPDFVAPVTSPFRDCDASTPHYKEICWLAERGISEGWAVAGGKEFRPYATVARCDMAAFLYRMAGSPSYTAPSTSPFKDCNGKTPHYKEVCWLAETGVSAGWDVSGGKEFRSYNTVARCDMAAFLHRMKNKGLV